MLITSLVYGKVDYAIEFEASDPPANIEEHLTKVKDYEKLLNAKEGWLVHFGTAKYQHYPKKEGVNSIYIWHDDNFTKWEASIQTGDDLRFVKGEFNMV